jgi:hypothetical protein
MHEQSAVAAQALVTEFLGHVVLNRGLHTSALLVGAMILIDLKIVVAMDDPGLERPVADLPVSTLESAT